MPIQYLNDNGLVTLWNKIKANFYTKTQLSNAVVHNQAATISGDLTPSALAQAVSTAPQNLTDAQQAQARSNIGSDKYGVVSQTISWTGGTGGYTYSISNISRGNIPQNNIALFECAGATFNETTGYFELNGLTDISYGEMLQIYTKSIGGLPFSTVRNSQFANYALRTTVQLFFPSGYSTSINHMYASSGIYMAYMVGCNNLGNTQNVFNGCNKLKKVFGTLKATSWNNVCFTNCYSLEEIQISSLKNSLYFNQSSKLSTSSIAFMITNEASTSAITITLHPTAYARAIADSDVQAALAAHTNVTLAQAS